MSWEISLKDSASLPRLTKKEVRELEGQRNKAEMLESIKKGAHSERLLRTPVGLPFSQGRTPSLCVVYRGTLRVSRRPGEYFRNTDAEVKVCPKAREVGAIRLTA